MNDARQYNLCVEKCQRPLRDSRFMIEFQIKEWQRNLNECFYFCRRDNSNRNDCVTYCLDNYNSILDEVKERLDRELDQHMS